jgi:hypothetical protein
LDKDNSGKRYISPQEFAALFGISVRTVYRRLDKLPVHQIGGKGGLLRIDMYEYARQNSIAVAGFGDAEGKEVPPPHENLAYPAAAMQG